VSDPEIRAARTDDLEIIEGLLSSVNLPLFRTADFLDTFWVAEVAGEVVGCVGLEVYDDAGLLRSAVVTEPVRGTGLGARLTRKVVDEAKSHGVRDLYLFTMDAGPFFGHMGFEKCTIEDFSENGRKCTQWIAVNNNREIMGWLTSMRMTLS
jgi:amino-acid N-acetyltransferase